MDENKNAVEKFDPSKLMDGVKDRIKATFISMIPDNHWEKLVENIIHRFMNDEKNNYTGRSEYSEFESLVRQELNIYLKGKIIQSIQKYMDKEWDKNGNELVNKHIKEIIIKNSEMMIANMFSNAAQDIVNQIQNNMNMR